MSRLFDVQPLEMTKMAFTNDVSTDIGKVRLLLSDLDSSKPIFPDDNQIQAFLDMELGDIKQAAALGLETIAGNRVMTMQVVQLLDLKMDGAQTARALLAVAEQHRNNSNLDWAGIDIMQVTDNSDFAWTERYFKMVLQQAAGAR